MLRAPVWELGLRAGRHHQPATALSWQMPIPDFTSAFRGIADMAGPADGFVSVENDPKRTFGDIGF